MTENSYKPKAKNSVTIQDLGDEVILYDSDKENVHFLNHTAHAIWNLCDGKHTLLNIQEKLERQFPEINAADLSEDIRTTIMEFKGKKLIIE